MDIRKTVRAAMTAKGITQGELSRYTGIDNGHLGKFLRGIKGMGTENLESIFLALGLAVNQE